MYSYIPTPKILLLKHVGKLGGHSVEQTQEVQEVHACPTIH